MDEENVNNGETTRGTGGSAIGFIIRFVVAAVVLLVTSWLVPGFSIRGFWTALIAALIISAVDYLIGRLFNFDAAPLGRGLSGFIVSAAIIYFTQYFVGNMSVSIWGALIGALVIGLIDMLLPTRFM
ncbi:MAG: phage holin family protein [Clostridiales bacterium]|nr:phage holin family protein [Clostridiales bacterium]